MKSVVFYYYYAVHVDHFAIPSWFTLNWITTPTHVSINRWFFSMSKWSPKQSNQWLWILILDLSIHSILGKNLSRKFFFSHFPASLVCICLHSLLCTRWNPNELRSPRLLIQFHWPWLWIARAVMRCSLPCSPFSPSKLLCLPLSLRLESYFCTFNLGVI